MVKKLFILIGSSVFGVLALQAEQLTFITTMSAPVGAFSRVEAQTSAVVTDTKLYDVGEIRLNATSDNRVAQLGNLTFGNGARMASNAGKFQAAKLNINQNGMLGGRHLIANEVTSQSAEDMVVGGQLIVPALAVNYARVDNLEITSGSGSKISRGPLSQTPEELTWQVNKQSVDGTGSGPAGEVLLKSPGVVEVVENSSGTSTNSTSTPRTKHNYLSPLQNCYTFSVSNGAINDGYYNCMKDGTNDNGLNCNGIKFCNALSSTRDFTAACQLEPRAREYLWSQGFIIADRSLFEPPSQEPSDCIPGKRYFLGSSDTTSCTTCFDTSHVMYGQGSVRLMYRMSYAVCVEATSYPFTYSGNVDCRLVEGDTSKFFLDGGRLLDTHN